MFIHVLSGYINTPLTYLPFHCRIEKCKRGWTNSHTFYSLKGILMRESKGVGIVVMVFSIGIVVMVFSIERNWLSSELFMRRFTNYYTCWKLYSLQITLYPIICHTWYVSCVGTDSSIFLLFIVHYSADIYFLPKSKSFINTCEN